MSSELVVALVTAVLSSIIGPIAVYYVQQLTEKKKKITYILKTKNIDLFSKEDMEKYGFQIISFK